jgi:hypothetical protein
VQVELTAFEAEHYPLAIQDNRAQDMTANDISVYIRSLSSEKSQVTIRVGKNTRLDRKPQERVFRKPGSVIGANTLSIIGQIEPGRTVRLYRQIH